MRQGGVDRDAVQPGGKRGFSAEGGQFAHHLQQDILGHVLGIDIAAQHAPRHVIDARRIVVVNLFGGKGNRVTIGLRHRRRVGMLPRTALHGSRLPYSTKGVNVISSFISIPLPYERGPLSDKSGILSRRKMFPRDFLDVGPPTPQTGLEERHGISPPREKPDARRQWGRASACGPVRLRRDARRQLPGHHGQR